MSHKSELCSCIYCKKEYTSKGIFTHVDRTHLHKTHYSSGNNGRYDLLADRAKKEKDNKIAKYLLSPKTCKTCNVILQYDDRTKSYCSHSCSAKANNKLRPERSTESKLRTSVKIKKPRYKCTCNICGTTFESIDPIKDYCTKKCRANKHRENLRARRPALVNYRIDCAFKFNLKDYPNEFDFVLIEQHGWYKAKNHGNNLTGVSRDHMVSVRYGFDNSIDPKILSHPANCQLLIHTDNSKKQMSCSITIEELLGRIKKWDFKYS